MWGPPLPWLSAADNRGKGRRNPSKAHSPFWVGKMDFKEVEVTGKCREE